ncbi:MAG: Rha family transcriptional regulator [Liquorilactobacillus nagelii]|uniref:Rha family transcriptional regulator n=1 Tax=Liquorilactobacillus nagelii TaxID=82688 RepID=UPI0039E7709D
MNKLVFVKDQSLNAVPFTTDEVIAEYSNNSLHAVRQMIRSNKNGIEEFGVLAFEMRKPPKGSKGGRPVKTYHLNRGQAIFLITLLGNSREVVQFKKQLVRQFLQMEKLLNDRFVKREAGKLATKALNDAIKAREDLDGHAYINFEQLAYKASLGKSATQIKRERLVTPNTPATEYLTTAELDKVNSIKQRIAALIDMGLEYHAIKAISTGQGIKALMINKTEPKAREGA